MDVQATQAVRNAGESIANGHAKSNGGDSLQKDDFLRLLMTQMTNQDPLNPLDSKGMMEQFAQMGTLEQLTNINGQLEKLNGVQSEISRSNAYTYLDKDVTVKGGIARISGGEAPTVNYNIPRDASVKVHINNENNTPIRSLDLGYQAHGDHQILWDGKDGDGDPVPNGSYTYNVIAETDDGTRVPVDLFVTGKVSGVRFEKGKQMIRMRGDDFDVRDVIGVSNESERLFSGRDPIGLRNDLTPMPPAPDRAK